jgi:MIP family channel proteins
VPTAAPAERGPNAYIAEFVGTFFLVFVIGVVVSLYVSTGGQAQFGSDFAVVGLVHWIILFLLVQTLFVVGSGHFNPAVTAAAYIMRQITAIDAVIFVLVQLSGGVAGALATKWILLDEGRSGHYGALGVSGLLGSPGQAFAVEAIGTFVLVFVIICVATAALHLRLTRSGAALAIGAALGMLVMIFGPLTGAGFNPARWFGPALVGSEWSDAWVYIVGPLVGAVVAAGFFLRVIAPAQADEQKAQEK